MTAVLSTVAAKDANNLGIPGGLQILDLSGTGVGPWSFGSIILDGVAGTYRAAVTSAGAQKVDGSGVTQPTSRAPVTSGGLTLARVQSAASTNAASIKASAAGLYVYDLGNNGASDAYVKLYNKASAPTVGTDTPVATIYVPKGARAAGNNDFGVDAFPLGLAIAITGLAADTDTTAVAANQVVGFIAYA